MLISAVKFFISIRELPNMMECRMAIADEVSREKLFSMLEKAVRPQFFLLITSFLIFADCILVRFSGLGLRDIESNTDGLNISLVLKFTLIFVCFSGLASLALPSVMVPALQLYIDVKYQIWLFFYNTEKYWLGSRKDKPIQPRQRPHNRVTPEEVLDAAHEGENTFLMDLYKDYDLARSQSDMDFREVQRYAFCALVFLTCNYWFLGSNFDHSITHWIADYCASSSPVWIAIAVLLWLVVLPVHQDNFGTQWIYCPPLYQKLEAEEDKRRKEEAEWREKVGIKREIEQARIQEFDK